MCTVLHKPFLAFRKLCRVSFFVTWFQFIIESWIVGLSSATFVMSQKICRHLKSPLATGEGFPHLQLNWSLLVSNRRTTDQTRTVTNSKGKRLTRSNRKIPPCMTGAKWLAQTDGYKRTILETACARPPPTAEDDQRRTHRMLRDPGRWLFFFSPFPVLFYFLSPLLCFLPSFFLSTILLMLDYYLQSCNK